MRVVYFGTPQFAAPSLAALLASQHTVVGVVTQPDRARGRGQHVTFGPVKQLALEHGVPVLQPERLKAEDSLAAIAALNAEIGVVAAYGKLLPQALLDLPPQGMVNVHASLLPRWRGAAPIHRAIQAGDTMTGVTIMRVVLALDAGPMLSRVELPIATDVTSDALEVSLADAGARLLIETLDRMSSGAVHEEPQDDTGVTYAAKLTRADSQVDWSRSAQQIHDQIRAMRPWPMVSVMWRGKRLILRTSAPAFAEASAGRPAHPRTDAPAHPESAAPAHPRTSAPAHLVEVSDALWISTGTDPLAITEVQLEGRRPQSAREFINGARPAVGDRFEPVSLT